MSAEIKFYLENEDIDRLYSLKQKQGKNNLTVNEFARELLEGILYNLQPTAERKDEDEL